MKQYLAVFLGKPEAMNSFRNLPEAERKEREQRGVSASRQLRVGSARSPMPCGSLCRQTAGLGLDIAIDLCIEQAKLAFEWRATLFWRAMQQILDRRDQQEKCLQYLKEAAPHITRVGVLRAQLFTFTVSFKAPSRASCR